MRSSYAASPTDSEGGSGGRHRDRPASAWRGPAVANYFFTVNIAAYLIGSNLIGFLNDRFGATADPAMMRYALLVCPLTGLLSAAFLYIGNKRRA